MQSMIISIFLTQRLFLVYVGWCQCMLQSDRHSATMVAVGRAIKYDES